MNNFWTIPHNDFWSTPNSESSSRFYRVPHHLRLLDYFTAEIQAGNLVPGSRLPPERDLAKKFSITRVTLRQALGRMEAEGLIFREERRGWFISPPRVHYDPTANASFSQSIANQGRTASTKVLSKHTIAASLSQCQLLDCSIADTLFAISRLRTVDGRPILTEKIHVRADCCPGLLDHPLDGSLTDLMADKYGIIEQRVKIIMRPTAIPEFAAKALGIAVGTPGLYLMRTILDQNNKVVEIDEEFWRHDAIDVCISTTG